MNDKTPPSPGNFIDWRRQTRSFDETIPALFRARYPHAHQVVDVFVRKRVEDNGVQHAVNARRGMIPSAREMTASAVNPGAGVRPRTPNRTSRQNCSIQFTMVIRSL